jgi:hypothetical protein
MTPAARIALLIKQLLESLQRPALAPFLADWPPNPRQREVRATGMPVLRWLPQIAGDGAAFGIDLVAEVCRAAASLAWRQTYTAADLDGAFLDNYAWSEILGTVGPVASEKIACGFLMLGAATHYPRHRHEAEEIYVPLSGAAAWEQGDAVWRERPPGTLIHHARDETHSMRTGAVPLLALYLWRSDNLGQKARLDSAAAGPSTQL